MMTINHKILLEKNRKELLLKQKRETPERVERANSYSINNVTIDPTALLSDWLVITTNISGNGSTYSDSIAFKFVMTDLIEQAKKSPKHVVNSKLIIKSIHESLDKQDIYIDCSCQDFCLHPDTKIKLLNKQIVSVKEMYNMHKNGEDLWVYSVDKNGEFKPGKVLDVFITKQETELIEITLDNDKKIITTPNHKYMLRDGTYREANSLMIGQSLMPLYFKEYAGYEQVKSNVNLKAWNSVYKIVANECFPNAKNNVFNRCGENNIAIHHLDYNKLNDYPSNLKPMGIKEHIKFHADFVSNRWKNDKSFRDAILCSLKESNNKRWNGSNNKENRKYIGEKIKEYYKSLTVEEKSKRIEWTKTIEGRKKFSKSLKRVWNNYDEIDRKKRNKISATNLNGIDGKKASKRMQRYWNNLSDEEYTMRCKNASKIGKERSSIISKQRKEFWKTIDETKKDALLDKTFRNPNNKKLANIGKMKKVIQYLIDNNIQVNEKNYDKYRCKSCAPKILTYFNNFEELLKECNYNHKIKSIKHISLDIPINVYDITIDKYENFYVDAGVILHNCYRYSFWSTQEKYKWGNLQTSNGKKIRNPKNDMGSMCKHLYALLRSNKFLNLISDKIMRTIMANFDVLVKKFNINILEFVVNTTAYDKMLRMNIDRDKSGKFAKKVNNDEIKNNNSQDKSNEESDETKTESIDNVLVSDEIQSDEKNNINKITQYYTNDAIMNIIKDNVNLDEYIKFIKYATKNIKTTTSLELYLINNISIDNLLNLLKDYNIKLYDNIIDNIIKRIFN